MSIKHLIYMSSFFDYGREFNKFYEPKFFPKWIDAQFNCVIERVSNVLAHLFEEIMIIIQYA